MDPADDRKKKRISRDNERKDEPGGDERSPRRLRTNNDDEEEPHVPQYSLTAFLADEHQRTRQAFLSAADPFQERPSDLMGTATGGSFDDSSQFSQFHGQILYPAAGRSMREDHLRDLEPHFPTRRVASSETFSPLDDVVDDTDCPSPLRLDRLDPNDLAWAEAERRLERDISSIQPLPILPPFHESRLIPQDRLDALAADFAARERSHRDRTLLYPHIGQDAHFRSTAVDDPFDPPHRDSALVDFSPAHGTITSHDSSQQKQQQQQTSSTHGMGTTLYDVHLPKHPRAPLPSAYAQMPSQMDRSPPVPSTTSSYTRTREDIQPIAAHRRTIVQNPATGGYIIPVLAPNDRLAMTPYQFILRESLEYFTAVDDDVHTTVQGRRKPVMPHQLGIRCRYCGHLPVAGRMRAAVYYPRSLMNLYQGAQNIASVHFQQCTEFPRDILRRLMVEKPRRDFSKVGKPYWAETCRQLGIYEQDDALWLRPPPETAAILGEMDAKPAATSAPPRGLS